MSERTETVFDTMQKTEIIHPSGVKIVQYLGKWEEEQHKCVWVRDSMSSMEIEGKPNYLCHANYEADNQISKECAIKRCKDAFCKHWEISTEF